MEIKAGAKYKVENLGLSTVSFNLKPGKDEKPDGAMLSPAGSGLEAQEFKGSQVSEQMLALHKAGQVAITEVVVETKEHKEVKKAKEQPAPAPVPAPAPPAGDAQ